MCGVAGFLRLDGGPAKDYEPDLAAMTDRLTHRGPDAASGWIENGIALGHRRLSVLDPSDAGDQPMMSRCGRFVLSFNGEIYNFPELTQDILVPAGIEPRSGSDTEVLVEVVARIGPEATLPRLNGMFAFALWDRRERTLHLARDRIGIKPLYWSRQGSAVLFASQVSSLAKHRHWNGALSDAGIWDFLHNTRISQDRTAYANCWKVEPGRHLILREDGSCRIETYFDLAELAASCRERAAEKRDHREAVAELDDLLHRVVRDQSRADVPVGAFLSGGIDSSLVVAMLRRDRPVRSFSIGYAEPEYDESEEARAIADHLDAEHETLVLTPEHAVEAIPALPESYDEPFADPSQIPTTLVSRLARDAVTVALSGDGGDELFAGYERYSVVLDSWRQRRYVPDALKRPVAWGLRTVPPALWRALLKPWLRDAGQSVPYYSKLLCEPDIVTFSQRANYLGIGAAAIAAQDGRNQPTLPEDRPPRPSSDLDRLLYHDQRIRLPDSMLTKVDRASMASSLEVRVPLLDNRILEFAWSLPESSLIAGNRRKIILRDVLSRHLPRKLFERPKKGFHVPLRLWLAGPLRDWAETMLGDGLETVSDYLDARAVQALWRRYLHGESHLVHPIWTALMLVSWRMAHRTPPPRPVAQAAE